MQHSIRGLVVAALLMAGTLPAVATTIFKNLPDSPVNTPNVLIYANTGTTRLGDEVTPIPGNWTLTDVTVALSNQAAYSSYPTYDASGYLVPVTLTLYSVDHSGSLPAVGSVLASRTVTPLIPWEPEHTIDCVPGAYSSSFGGECYTGVVKNVTFDFSGTDVPQDFIYGLEFPTQDYGDHPTGTDVPQNALGFGISDLPPTVGTDTEPNAIFWQTISDLYADGGAGGHDFRRDPGWSLTQNIQFDAVPTPAVPEPPAAALLLLPLAAIAFLLHGKGGRHAS